MRYKSINPAVVHRYYPRPYFGQDAEPLNLPGSIECGPQALFRGYGYLITGKETGQATSGLNPR